MGIDDAGRAEVVWVKSGTSHLERRRYAAGQWGAVETLVSAAVTQPALAMAGTGDAMVAWIEEIDSSTGSLHARRYDAASDQWEPRETVRAANVLRSLDHAPRVAMAAGGDAQVVWNDTEGGDHAAARRHAGGQWEEVVELATQQMIAPHLVMNRRGDAALGSFRFGGIYVQRARAAGLWGAPEEMRWGDVAFSGVRTPQVAIDETGDVMALWLQDAPTIVSLLARRYDAASGHWETAAVLVDDADVYLPRLAGNASGAAVAVWLQWDGSGYSLKSRRYDPGSGQWTAVETLNTEGVLHVAPFFAPDVAMDGRGNAIALWIQDDTTEWTVRARRYDAAAGQWGSPEVLGAQTAGALFLPQLAMNREGEAVAIWLEDEGVADALTLVARRYQ